MDPHDDRGRLGLRALPPAALALLRQTAATVPARLVAHLILVHHVACRLVAGLERAGLGRDLDGEVVRLGAALHDIGKVRYPAELVGPGVRHEAAGEELLLAAGFDRRVARCAASHGRPPADAPLEELLVALADTCWKGKRDQSLESAVADRVSGDRWPAWALIDALVEDAAANAELWLAWQARFP